MRRGIAYDTFTLIGAAAAFTALAEGSAAAATPTFYNTLPGFQVDITTTVTDDYSNPGYVFQQSNAVMSAVLGETDYQTTGFQNHNLVSGQRYCAGCNGSFLLIFTSTTVGDANGVHGVGLNITTHALNTPYFAFITFGDGTTQNVALPAAGTFWGVSAPERIKQIHFGLSMGASTTGGSFQIDNLVIGKGAFCTMDAECADDNNVCTSPKCTAGKCGFANNTDPCDDGDMCTENDACAEGTCGGTPKVCDDANACTDDSCDPAMGCVAAPNADPCDDGDMCTENDVCAEGMCGGAPLACNDDDLCTMDSCDPGMGCVNAPTPGCCLDDDGCAENEMCNLDTNTCEPSAISGSTGGGSTGIVETTGDETTGTTGDATTGGGTTEQVTTGAETGTGGGTGTGGTGDGTTGELTGGVDPGTGTGGSATDTGGGAGDSGCSCSTDSDAGGGAWLLLAALGGLIGRRRRA